MDVMVTTRALKTCKFLSDCHHQQTNTQLFYRPDNDPVAKLSCYCTEERKYHIPRTLSPQAHLEFSNLVFVTKGSWLPWGRLLNLLSALIKPQHTFWWATQHGWSHHSCMQVLLFSSCGSSASSAAAWLWIQPRHLSMSSSAAA